MDGPFLSRRSLRRFTTVVNAVTSLQSTEAAQGSIALADRQSASLLRRLDLDSGALCHADQTQHDFVILDGRAARDLSRAAAVALKARLAEQGVIAVHAPHTLLSRLASSLRRRSTDAAGYRPLRGVSRSEAALVEAGLYVEAISIRSGWRTERWLVASTAPANDRRFRDSIGRVATDYLNVAAIVAGSVPAA